MQLMKNATLIAFASICIMIHHSDATEKLSPEAYDELMHSERNGMVKFYQPGCGHCTAMKPAWDRLADTVDSSVFIADVSCASHEKLCRKNKVKGFPTIYYYKDGYQHKYEGGRSFEELWDFVTENLIAPCNIHEIIEGDCSERALKYIDKWQTREEADIWKEIYRLRAMQNHEMKHELKVWINERISILKQMVPPEFSITESAHKIYSFVSQSLMDSYILNTGSYLAAALWEEAVYNFKKLKKSVKRTLFPDARTPAFIAEWENKSMYYLKKEIWRLQQLYIKDKSGPSSEWYETQIEILKAIKAGREEHDEL